jgi:hypothetical protein
MLNIAGHAEAPTHGYAMICPGAGLRMQTVIDVNGADGPGVTLTQLAQGMEQGVGVDATAVGDLYGNAAAKAVVEYAR